MPNKKAFITLLLSFAAGYSFCQHLHTRTAISSDSVIVSGKITDFRGGAPAYQVFVVDENNPLTGLAKASGLYSIKIKPADTILFRSAGLAEKKVCIHDSLKPGQYKFTLNIRLDSLKGYFVIAESDSVSFLHDSNQVTAMINKLYVVFNRIDTLHKFTTGTEASGKRAIALKKAIDYYVLHPFINRIGFIPFGKMSSAKFYDFLGFLSFNYDLGAVRVWKNDTPRQLVADTRHMYDVWKSIMRERRKLDAASEQAQTQQQSNNNSQLKTGHGPGSVLVFLFYLAGGIAKAASL